VINELLEELHPRPALLPADPVARAEARAWIVYANDVLAPASLPVLLALAGEREGEAQEKPLAALRDAAARLEPQVARAGGPFFLGGAFSLVDAAYAPFFRRWTAAEGWGERAPRLLDHTPAVAAWARALAAHPSVVAATPDDFAERHRKLYADRAARARAAA
jgi:glutathione S-transferase